MSTATDHLVRIEGVNLKFADNEVLKSVDLTVESGDVLVIMGLSGCGKSTLLGILMGLLKVTAGKVFFKGSDLTKISRPELNSLRIHMGMVYQNASLISSMNVSENIGLPLRELTSKTTKEIEMIVNQKLELVGLKDISDKLPSELSGGMEKRVGLARALAMEPELILFDEPSAGLDPINSKLIDDLIIRLRDTQKVSSIVVTHEMPSAFAVASRMAFLHEGTIIHTGTPQEFRNTQNPIIQKFLTPYSTNKKEEK